MFRHIQAQHFSGIFQIFRITNLQHWLFFSFVVVHLMFFEKIDVILIDVSALVACLKIYLVQLTSYQVSIRGWAPFNKVINVAHLARIRKFHIAPHKVNRTVTTFTFFSLKKVSEELQKYMRYTCIQSLAEMFS